MCLFFSLTPLPVRADPIPDFRDCPMDEPLKGIYRIDAQNQIRVVGRNTDLIEFWSRGNCLFADRIDDGYLDGNDLSWFGDGLGAETPFAVRQKKRYRATIQHA